MIWENFFSIALKAGRVHRPVIGSVLEFQQKSVKNCDADE